MYELKTSGINAKKRFQVRNKKVLSTGRNVLKKMKKTAPEIKDKNNSIICFLSFIMLFVACKKFIQRFYSFYIQQNTSFDVSQFFKD